MMSTAVEIFYGNNAEARQALLKLFEFIAGEHIIFPALRTPPHDESILALSPNIRPRIQVKTILGLKMLERISSQPLFLTFRLRSPKTRKTGEGNWTTDQKRGPAFVAAEGKADLTA